MPGDGKGVVGAVGDCPLVGCNGTFEAFLADVALESADVSVMGVSEVAVFI